MLFAMTFHIILLLFKKKPFDQQYKVYCKLIQAVQNFYHKIVLVLRLFVKLVRHLFFDENHQPIQNH